MENGPETWNSDFCSGPLRAKSLGCTVAFDPMFGIDGQCWSGQSAYFIPKSRKATIPECYPFR